MRKTMSTSPREKRTNQPTVRANVAEELSHLRDKLWRIVKEVRMKSKGASDDIQRTCSKLEREVERFSDQVAEASDHAYDDLNAVGEDLRVRFEKLANHIAMPAS